MFPADTVAGQSQAQNDQALFQKRIQDTFGALMMNTTMLAHQLEQAQAQIGQLRAQLMQITVPAAPPSS